MVMSDKDAGAALAEVIGGGVVPRSELRDRLAEAGYRISANDVDRRIQMDPRFLELGDGIGYIPGLTEGVAFSLWIDPATAAEGYILMKPELDAIGWWIVECAVDVFDESGERIGDIQSDGWMIDDLDTDVVVGPDGWLDAFSDSWVAFRVRQGKLVIEQLVGPPEVDPDRAAAARTAFYAVADHQQYQPHGSDEVVDVMRSQVSTVLHEAIRADHSLMAGEPLPSSTDLLAAAGLRVERRSVVPADLDPEVLADADRERQSMFRWGVDADDALGAQILLGAIGLYAVESPMAFGATPDEQETSPVMFEALLERKSIATVVAYECSETEGCEAARGLAATVAALFEDDPTSWAMRWLVAHCDLVLGDIDSAAVVLDDLPGSTGYLPVLIDRARLAIARSQAKEAQKLLREAERLVEDLPKLTLLPHTYRKVIDDLQDEIEVWADNTPPPMARRNERCPCGSGRKYKVCHLGRELHPIEDRSLWLYHKMVRFAREQADDEIDSLAGVLTDVMGEPSLWAEMIKAPLISDVVLHEEEFEQGFLDGRLSTLPDDEVLLAQQWMLVDRTVFEVESTSPGSIELRDLGTGEMIEVVNVDDNPMSRPGSLLIGRPLPVGDIYRAFSGFMALRPDLVQAALSVLDDKDPDALMELLGSMHRAPEIRNTDGHEMEPTEVTWSLPDGADVAEALGRAGLTDDGDSWTLVRDTANQSNALVASIQLDGDTMLGSTNSVERAGELLELIAEHVPDAVHLSTKVSALDEFDENDPPELPNQAEMLANPEIRAAIEAHMANYETEWLDSAIPALGGRTPREAAADPIAREDLIRLLASFPEVDDGAVGMSPQRLRAALGL